ncbi:response regulator transcription factor [Proteiniborus sp. MB09-C3]|uniref:response regulator transcription factor n=1 Tax=Proteiniborus sp. MB09-C3 TaxID=3050072 RepID=UPI003325EC58
MIYIVEDDKNIRELESYALQSSGYIVKSFENSSDFYNACKELLPDLVLLDIMLPDEDGISILRNLRNQERTKNIPIIMVTAKTTELDKVKGLDAGADDYISKPFGVMELISRVKALLRRARQSDNIRVLSFGDIILDDERHRVTVKGKDCELTFKEFELLKYLLHNQGIVLSRDRIMEQVWGFEFEGESRTVDMHIKTLRQKLGIGGKAIKTVRNVGYKIGD